MTISCLEFDDRPPPPIPSLSHDLARSLVHLLDCARRDIDADQDAARATIARASSLLQVELDRGAHQGEEPAPGRLASWQVRRITKFIDEHLDQTIHTKDLAAIAQRSTAYFCRAFKKTFGETPHNFIIQRRLARAGELMLTGDRPLSEIALMCGFTDQAHLCKLFRIQHGHSPAAWRREHLAIGGPANAPGAPDLFRTGTTIRRSAA